jgi:lipoprotein-releasing system permease protein
MTFAWFVSRRYLRAKRRHKFISLISVIAILGVAVGVMALIVVLSIYTGFTDGLRDQIIGINSHVIAQSHSGQILHPKKIIATIEQIDGVRAATPYIHSQALISSRYGSSGIVLRGIDTEDSGRVIQLDEKMVSGSMNGLISKQGIPSIILGSELASLLRVQSGDRVRLISPDGPLSPMGIMPRVRPCIVAGIFETGMFEYDSSMGFISLETARSLAGLDLGVHGIEVRVDRVEDAGKIAGEIRATLGPGFSARDWMQLNQNLFAALQLEKIGMFIALNLIILVAALNIISALIMLVMEKKRDIGILKSMGASTGSIMRIFFYQGMVIGAIGTVLGILSGLGICWLLKTYPIIELPRNVYPMSTLPVEVVHTDVIVVSVCAFLITLAATLYPSWKASRIRPAEALSHE